MSVTDTDTEARLLAARYLRRRQSRYLAGLVLGALLIAFGTAGRLALERHVDRLRAHGVRVTGTVVSLDLPPAFPALRGQSLAGSSILVRYRTPAGTEQRSLTGGNVESVHYGDRVRVVYDPADPGEATVASGPPRVGVGGTLAIVAIILGAAFALLAGRALWRLRRRFWPAVEQRPRHLAVTRGGAAIRGGGVHVPLLDHGTTIGALVSTDLEWPPHHSTQVVVYGTVEPGADVVVVDPLADRVTGGADQRATMRPGLEALQTG